MNVLLVLFALPVATIIISSVFVKLLKSPIAVSAITFAIYLIVTFAVFDATFLIATIIYTVLSFVSASITKIIIRYLKQQNNNDENNENERCMNGLNTIVNTDDMPNIRANNFRRCR